METSTIIYLIATYLVGFAVCSWFHRLAGDEETAGYIVLLWLTSPTLLPFIFAVLLIVVVVLSNAYELFIKSMELYAKSAEYSINKFMRR